MRYGHIITVGTSLTLNKGGKGSSCKERNDAVSKLNEACTDLDAGVEGADISEQREQAKKALLELDPQNEFDYRPPQRNMPKDRLPQELSYLWAFAHDPRYEPTFSEKHKHMVLMLASHTYESKNCALIICDVLNSTPWNEWYTAKFSADKDFAKDVDDKRGVFFEKNGFHNWMEKIQEMIEALKEANCKHIFLNVTGGYKGTVPHSTLIGMLNNDIVEITYLFEESKKIICLPVYPIGLDFRQWHENALRLRMVQEQKEEDYFIPDPPVNNLIQNDGDLSAFGKALDDRYAIQLTTDPLKIYSKHIITRLLNEKGPWSGGIKPRDATDADRGWWIDNLEEICNLRTILHNLIDKTGDIIWLGDKIPEMVEHAQRHHHNLLEFTELFLTPILYYKPNFLNARERFILLSAVMLHDCGHSLDRISVQACKDLAWLFGDVNVQGLGEEIALFPNDVRDYHQYLAGIRLNDNEMAADLGWPGRRGLNDMGLPEALHDAVILACLYHRRRMDYDKDTGKQVGKLHPTGQWPGPLYCNHDKYKQECNVDLMKIVALLRLIDGCDSQARRAGPRAHVMLTLSLLKRDYQTAAMRAGWAYDAFLQGPNCGLRECLNQALVREIRDTTLCQITEPWRLEDSNRERRIESLRILQNDNSTVEQKQCARLWLMTAEAADRAEMRFGHFPHFIKHLAVSEIHVLPDKNSNEHNLTFNIILVPDESDIEIKDPYDHIRCGTVKDHWLKEQVFKKKGGEEGEYNTLKKTIEIEISDEYDQVSNYAKTILKLKAVYWWQDQWKLRDNGGQPFYPEQ